MIEKARFRVEYPSGYVDVIVGEFFGTSDKKKIRKLLRIASRYCSETQQAKLIRDITAEHDRCATALDKLDELIGEQQKVLSDFFGGVQYRGLDVLSGAMRSIARRQNKLMWSRNQVVGMRWVG